MRFRRYRDDASAGAVRTALTVMVLVSTKQQIELAEKTLISLAYFKPPADAYPEALVEELRLVIQVSEERRA
jgi:hypothetical protein